MFFAVVLVELARRLGLLTDTGAVLAGVIGIGVIVTVGAVWLLPLLIFFVSSTLLGRLLPSRRLGADRKAGRARDVVQVFCNGGIYLSIALFSSWLPDWRLALLVAAAVATADTWASTIGQYFGWRTYDYTRLRWVPPGVSGGISGPGTLGGVAGGALIAALGFGLIAEFTWADWLQVASWAVFGLFLDSSLGSAYQIRYFDEAAEQLTDREPEFGYPVSGLPWVTNDGVNLAAIGLTVGLFFLFHGFGLE